MGNLSSHDPLGPDASQWYPVKDGNYTVWKGAFEQKIEKYCGGEYSFRVGRKIHGGGVSETAFRNTFSGSGAGHLRNAIAKSSLGSYVGKKAGNIVLMVFGLLVFCLCIGLAFALLKGCRSCLSKVIPDCRAKRRPPPQKYEGFGAKVLCYKLVALLSFGVLFALGIAAFVFAARLNQGTQAITCDFWLTNYGHFFGTDAVQELPASAVSGWLGTAPMWDHMRQMAYSTNPKPDGPDGMERCPMCNVIEDAYSGPGGMKEKLIASRDNMALVTNKAILIGELSTKAVEQATQGSNGDKDVVGPAAVAAAKATQQQGVAAVNLFRSYATDLAEVVNTGVVLFRNAIDLYLGRDSAVLQQGYSTAKDALTALDDVNFLMAKILVMWDKDVYPLVRALVTVLVVLTVLCGVFGVVVGLVGFFLLWKFQRQCKENRRASKTMTKCLGGLYAALIIFAGTSFLLFAVQMFAGSAGSDACAYVRNDLYDSGDWEAFPPKLLGETATNKTNMEAVLDTCVKRSGDGDVAGTLGLRVLLANLKRNVDATAATLQAQVDSTLKLNFRDQKAGALKQIAEDVQKLTVLPRLPIEVKGMKAEGADAEFALRKGRVFNMPQMALNPRLTYETKRLSLMNLMLGSDLLAALSQLQGLGNIFQPITPMQQRIPATEALLKEAGTDSKLCSATLQDQGVCSLDTATTLDVLDDTANSATFADAFEKLYAKQGAEGVENLAQGLFEMRIASRFVGQTLRKTHPTYNIGNSILTNFTAELPGWFTDLVDPATGKPNGLTFERVLGDMVPQLRKYCSTELDIDCPIPAVLNAVDDYFQELGVVLDKANKEGAWEVQNFVTNTTLAKFYGMLSSAESDLANFNCQYLGTVLEASVVEGLCGVAMPAVTSIGLVAMVFTLAGALGAWVLWRAFRYFRDLEVEGAEDSSSTAVIEFGQLPPFKPLEEQKRK